jgi:hypothetical protein
MKAELFSSDFMISILLFLTVLTIIIAYYQNLQTDVYETDIRNDMHSKAINVASLLATTSGYPKYWDSTNVQIIGLYDSGKFNLTKFEELKQMTQTEYQTVRVKLGTGNYNFYISLKNTTENIIVKPSDPSFSYSCGIDAVNADQVVLIKRLGVVNLEGNATKVTMEVILWI